MFELYRPNPIRIGKICVNKCVDTPAFFSTSNFGGGGTNVARFLAYGNLLSNVNVKLLMNYYYLNVNSGCSPRFDADVISDFNRDDLTVADLVSMAVRKYQNKVHDFGNSITAQKWDSFVMLDSGSGNILRDTSLGRGEDALKYYSDIIFDYLNFLETHKFDIGISMDFTLKNTYKNNENRDNIYLEKLREVISRNSDLSELTLRILQDWKGTFKPNLFAPLHGSSISEYTEYLDRILAIEIKMGKKFDGFAIGGLGKFSLDKSDGFGVPLAGSGDVKEALYLFNTVSAVRSSLSKKQDIRPIHVLGSASLYNLIPLLLAGADTFDDHSAWRRSSDGNDQSKDTVKRSISGNLTKEEMKTSSGMSKMVVPMLDDEGEFIKENKENYLQYLGLHSLSDDNCRLDSLSLHYFSLKEIKQLYTGNVEDNYLAKIVMYLYSIDQYNKIISKLKTLTSKEDVIEFIRNMPDCNYKTFLSNFIKVSDWMELD